MSREKQIEEISEILTEAAHKACEDIPFAPLNVDDRCIRPTTECHCCKEARALIDAGYRKQEWISVDERLPKKSGYFLVYIPIESEGFRIRAYYYCGDEAWESGYAMASSEYHGITHWMPLPEAPKGGAE